jgi:hypothetical protein
LSTNLGYAHMPRRSCVADDLDLCSVLIALDCLEVVFSSVLAEINDRIQQRGNTTFGHERKEFNEEAHNLYRYAFNLAMCGSENLPI